MAVAGQVNRLITFGQSTIAWDSEAPPFEKNRQSALQHLRHIVDADTAAAERTASKQEEDARRSQQANQSTASPTRSSGSSSSTTATSPSQAEAVLWLVWTPRIPGLARTLVLGPHPQLLG